MVKIFLTSVLRVQKKITRKVFGDEGLGYALMRDC
jgi:hypothetical protein